MAICPSQSPRRFRLLRHFSVASLLAFFIVAVLSGEVWRRLELHNLTKVAERQNVALAQTFVNALGPQLSRLLTAVSELSGAQLREHPETAKLHHAILAQMTGLSVVNVKLYTLQGLTVFSIQASQIGENQSANPGILVARSGRVISTLTRRGTYNAFDQTIEDRDVLASYIPMRREGPTGHIEGIFELYDDVTPLVERMTHVQQSILLGITSILATLYIILFVIVRHADRILRQQDTERQHAEEALQQAHAELEVRVQERTADLVTANLSLQHEISERKRLEHELLNVRKLESVGLLAGGIAHDFNNILTVIMGNISLAKMDVPPHAATFARLTEAENASQRATALTRRLLTFSTGGAPIRRPTAIAALLKESASIALQGSKVRAEFSLPDDLWPVDADAGQINQVITNVVINADQAMPEGGSLHVRAENMTVVAEHALPLRAGRYVKVSITDQGVGIPEEHLPKIFDPYFTTKTQGSGLGLAAAYAIVQKHNGYMTPDSAVGEGTTFSIYLPVAQSRVIALQSVVGPQRGSTGKILVMDDEASIRQLVEHMLTQMGYKVESTPDGVKTVRLYTQAKEAGQSFAAVILDLTIPGGMGGKETLQQLLKIDPHITAIVSSGYSTNPVMANFEQYGFRGVLTKPYRIEELSAVLHRVLAGEENLAGES